MGLNLVKVCSVCPHLAESSGGLQGSKSVSEGTAGKPVQPVQHADLCHIILCSSVIVLGLITSGVTPAQQNGCIKQLSTLIWKVHNLRIVCKTLRGRIKRCFTYCLQLFIPFFFFFGMCLHLVWLHDLMFIKGIFFKGERSYSFLSVSKDT